MIDIVETDDLSNITRKLIIRFRFTGIDYLVADRFGNFFVLPHCPNKRTIRFKHLGKNREFIYYHKSKKYMPELRRKGIFVNEEYIM